MQLLKNKNENSNPILFFLNLVLTYRVSQYPWPEGGILMNTVRILRSKGTEVMSDCLPIAGIIQIRATNDHPNHGET